MFQNGRYVALADYCAIGNSEVNMKEGDVVELLKVGCAGWWFVRMIGKYTIVLNCVENLPLIIGNSASEELLVHICQAGVVATKIA